MPTVRDLVVSPETRDGLRKLELDERREVGVIIRDRAVVRKIERTFERDWRLTPEARKGKVRRSAA